MSRWEFGSREDFEAVLLLEFPGGEAGDWLVMHPGALSMRYGYVLFCATTVRYDYV
jgi:hypothetical protein